jgi:hypothetical protein
MAALVLSAAGTRAAGTRAAGTRAAGTGADNHRADSTGLIARGLWHEAHGTGRIATGRKHRARTGPAACSSVQTENWSATGHLRALRRNP